METLIGIVGALWAMHTVKALVVLIVSRIVPNKWIFNTFYGIGVVVTGGGSKFFGRFGLTFLWNKIEDLLENSLMSAWNGFRAGLNSDDSVKVDAMRELTDGV